MVLSFWCIQQWADSLQERERWRESMANLMWREWERSLVTPCAVLSHKTIGHVSRGQETAAPLSHQTKYLFLWIRTLLTQFREIFLSAFHFWFGVGEVRKKISKYKLVKCIWSCGMYVRFRNEGPLRSLVSAFGCFSRSCVHYRFL